MANFKIENKKLKVEIFDVVHEVRKPNYKELREMQERIQGLSDKERTAYMVSQIVACGIPEDVIDQLDSDSLIDLISIVNGTKKN